MTKDARPRTVMVGRGPRSEPKGNNIARPHSGETRGGPKTQPKPGRHVTPQPEAAKICTRPELWGY